MVYGRIDVKREIDHLIADLNCNDPRKCQVSRRRLVAMGSEAVPALVEALSSKKQWVRWEAAKALGQIGDPSATKELINAFYDKSFDVRWLAAEGLIAIGIPTLAPLLDELIKNSKSTWLLEGAHHVLSDMDRGYLEEVLKPVVEAIDGPQPSLEVPLAAKKALDKLRELEPSE
jgi:HEAT repeat protein